MINTPVFSPEQEETLVAELHRLGIRHLARLKIIEPISPMAAEDLIAGLASNSNARLQASLILLFLRRPSLSSYIPMTLSRLAPPLADTLRLYYQAAVYLRCDLDDHLRQHSDDVAPLPNLFSNELGVPMPGTVSTDVALAALGQVHTRLSGWSFNWAGSYRQNIPLFLKRLKRT